MIDVVSLQRSSWSAPFSSPRPARVTGPHGRSIRRCPARRCRRRAARCSIIVTADGVPFPFEALVRKIEARAGCAPANVRQAGADPARPLAAAHRRGAGLLRLSARRRRRYRRRRGSAARARPDLPRLPGESEPDRGHQLQRAVARFEFQLVRDYRAGGTPRVRVRQSRRLHRLPPESRADLLAPGVGRDECESARSRRA